MQSENFYPLVKLKAEKRGKEVVKFKKDLECKVNRRKFKLDSG